MKAQKMRTTIEQNTKTHVGHEFVGHAERKNKARNREISRETEQMPIYDKRDRNNWYNSIPVSGRQKANPLADPDFSIEKMPENEIDFGNGSILAKIPEIEGRIFRRDDKDRNGTYIVFLTDSRYDKELKQTRNDKVIIGTELFGKYEGLMMANENYHLYFDTKGRLINDPMKKRKEEEAREQTRREAEENKTTADRDITARKVSTANDTTRTDDETTNETNDKTTNNSTQTTQGERTVDEIKESLLRKEKLLKQQLRALEQKHEEADIQLQELREKQERLDELIEVREYEMTKKAASHFDLLYYILDDFLTMAKEQAKRRPDALMRITQIRAINEILEELQTLFKGTEAEDYLHLAAEPQEDDLEHHPGTTYGEMAILLSAYTHTINACRGNRLFWKTKPSTEEGKEEDEE